MTQQKESQKMMLTTLIITKDKANHKKKIWHDFYCDKNIAQAKQHIVLGVYSVANLTEAMNYKSQSFLPSMV